MQARLLEPCAGLNVISTGAGRHLKRSLSTPFVISTGAKRSGEICFSHLPGADAYLLKPHATSVALAAQRYKVASIGVGHQSLHKVVILNVTEGGVKDLQYLPVTNRREAPLSHGGTVIC